MEEKAKNPHGLEFPNLPFYVDGDVKLTQSPAILHYLAKKHGLAGGNTDADWRRFDVLEDVVSCITGKSSSSEYILKIFVIL